MQPRTYDEAVAYAVARMNERALHREGLGLDPEANYLDATLELACSWELIGYVYRVDADTGIEDVKAASEAYDGKRADLRKPGFLRENRDSGGEVA